MSRHRSAYAEEDLYDYEDDYYEEDDYYDEQQQSQPTANTASFFDVAQCHKASPGADKVNRDEQIGFILDMLGSGSVVTPARVGQMLDLYSGDTEQTISYFLTQKAAEVAPAPVASPTWPVKKKVTIESAKAGAGPKAKSLGSQSTSTAKSVGSGSATIATTAAGAKKETHSIVLSNKDAKQAKASGPSKGDDKEDSLAFNAEKLAMRLVEKEREEMQCVQDLDFMGFGEEAASVEVQKGSMWTVTKEQADSLKHAERSALLTDTAPLSDDEFEDDMKVVPGTKAGEGLAHMTMVVAGHVDAGKSTLVGNLLVKAGQVAQRTMHKYQKESSQQGKGSFALAWVMDESAAEREHGVTIDIAERQISTKTKLVKILDAPGHRDFIPNMISGATFADTALLVIPASVGEYESSMGEKAQTREHAVLLKALGVNQLLVVVNKMDMTLPAWSQDRFEVIRHEIGTLLTELQFSVEKNVRFIPVAGLSGENIFDVNADNAALRSWYTGPVLIEAIDSFRDPVRLVNKPMRAIVTAVVSEKEKTCTVRANVQQGRLRCGRGVGLTTSHGVATVKSIVNDDGMNLKELEAGQAGTLVLVDRSGRSGGEMGLTQGMILCKGPPVAQMSRKFRGTILTMANIMPPIMPGSTFEMYVHGEELQCKVSQIISMKVKDKHTGVVTTKKAPKCVPGSRSAVVVIETLERKVCIESFSECRGLGRFALRATGGTVAVGVCDSVIL